MKRWDSHHCTHIVAIVVKKFKNLTLQGIPTHDAKGEEISKSAMKGIMKKYQAQEKKYNDYLKSQNEQ